MRLPKTACSECAAPTIPLFVSIFCCSNFHRELLPVHPKWRPNTFDHGASLGMYLWFHPTVLHSRRRWLRQKTAAHVIQSTTRTSRQTLFAPKSALSPSILADGRCTMIGSCGLTSCKYGRFVMGDAIAILVGVCGLAALVLLPIVLVVQLIRAHAKRPRDERNAVAKRRRDERNAVSQDIRTRAPAALVTGDELTTLFKALRKKPEDRVRQRRIIELVACFPHEHGQVSYERALALLEIHPTVPGLRALALACGRANYGAQRGGARTTYDEAAIANDIAVRTG